MTEASPCIAQLSLRFRLVTCSFPRLSSPWLCISVVKKSGHPRASVSISVHPWLRLRFENVTSVTPLLRLLLRLELSKSPGFTELVTLVTAVTPKNRSGGGEGNLAPSARFNGPTVQQFNAQRFGICHGLARDMSRVAPPKSPGCTDVVTVSRVAQPQGTPQPCFQSFTSSTF